MPRLFVALELPPEILDDLGDVRGGVEGARWQRDDQLHVTLAFMGKIAEHRMQDVADQLGRITMTPFSIKLKGVNKFGKDGRIKSLWAGMDDATAVTHLHEKVMRAIGSIGVDLDERRFIPHVTLARFHRRAEPNIQPWLHANENFTTKAGMVGHFTLFSSHQTDEGSFYRAEEHYGPSAAYAENGYEDGGSYG